MDEEITIIDSNTRNEKIKNFFINNRKMLIIGFSIIMVVLSVNSSKFIVALLLYCKSRSLKRLVLIKT